MSPTRDAKQVGQSRHCGPRQGRASLGINFRSSRIRAGVNARRLAAETKGLTALLAQPLIALSTESPSRISCPGSELNQRHADFQAAWSTRSPRDPAGLRSRTARCTDWVPTRRVIGEYSDETEARIAPFDAVPLNVADWWPPASPASSM